MTLLNDDGRDGLEFGAGGSQLTAYRIGLTKMEGAAESCLQGLYPQDCRENVWKVVSYGFNAIE